MDALNGFLNGLNSKNNEIVEQTKNIINDIRSDIMKENKIMMPIILDEETFFKLKAICEVEKMEENSFFKNYINNIFGFKKLYSDKYFDFLNGIRVKNVGNEVKKDEK